MEHHSHDHYHGEHAHSKGTLEHHSSVVAEILCHLPYAIFSVALSMIVLSFISSGHAAQEEGFIAYRLFHNFHYLHLLFAATGTVLIFRKYSQSTVWSCIVGFIVPAFFCTVSDAFLPYLGGKMVNLDMHFHWCFISHLDVVIPFLVGGIINGLVMSWHVSSRQLFYSLGFHFVHIFISSMASILYLVSFGFHDWWVRMGFVFGFLIFAVLIPCTLSDIVVPMLFAKIIPLISKRTKKKV